MENKRNIPKRKAKDMRKLLRKDVELTDEDRALRLAEYNYFFDTNYSFEDVFGKEVVEKATKEKFEYFKKHWLLYIDIENNLPDDDYKETALTFIVNFLYNDFSEFERMLAEDITMVIYNHVSLSGKQAVLEYWKDYRHRIREEIVTGLYVRFFPYYSSTGVLLKIRECVPVCLLYRIEDGKIKTMVYYFSDSQTTHVPEQTVNSLPYTIEEVNKYYEGNASVEANHLPCFHCGRPSEQLKWIVARYQYYNDLIYRKHTICQECHCVVENIMVSHQENVFEYDESRDDDTVENGHIEETFGWVTEPEENKDFAELGNRYRNHLEEIAREQSENKDALFELLPELHLRDGYHVGFGEYDVDNPNGFYYFYVFDPVLNMEKAVYDYVDVKATPMGVWQYFLLCNNEAFVEFNTKRPDSRNFRLIFDKSDLEKIPELRKRDIRRLEQRGLLFPTVRLEKMKDGSDGCIGELQCSYWRWESLWREYAKYIIAKDGKVKSEISELLLYRTPEGLHVVG